MISIFPQCHLNPSYSCESQAPSFGTRSRLEEHFLEDPSFMGDWVHQLCGNAYPVIFRVVTVDPSDDTFTLSTDCPAGRDMFEVIQCDSLGLLMLVAGRTSSCCRMFYASQIYWNVAFGCDSGCGEGSLQWAGAKWRQASNAPGGVLSMVLVCAQSAALQHRAGARQDLSLGMFGLPLWCDFWKASKVAEVKQVLSTWFNKIG